MNRFLIIQTAFIGDVILATSLIEKLYKYYEGDVSIDFLLRKGNESLLVGNSKVNEVIIWDKKSAKYLNLFRVIRKVRKNKYDYVVNVHRFSSSGLITKYSGAQYKIGFDKNPYSKHYHYKISHKMGSIGNSIYQHEVDRCLKLVSVITDDQPALPRLYPSTEDDEKVKEYIDKPFITISPISVWFTKQYPEAKWVDMCNELKDMKIYLLGGPDDESKCNKILELSENMNIVNLAGKLSLLQSASLMTHAQMNYVNDSAPMHLCSAMNAPVAVVYCSTVKEFGFGPLSDDSHIIQTKVNLECRPCGLHGFKKCPEEHFKCTKTIHTSQLVNIIKH